MQDRRFFASMTANLINTNGWVRRSVTADQLLGVKSEDGKWASQMTVEEKKAQRERIRESLRKRRTQTVEA